MNRMDIASFKRMCRLLEYLKRVCLARKWEEEDLASGLPGLSLKQLNHLMLIRFALPCNLGLVMKLTGLSPSAASIFVDKMVRCGALRRTNDTGDRRNILIDLTSASRSMLERIDAALDAYIDEHLQSLTPEDAQVLDRAGRIICGKFENEVRGGSRN